MKINAAPDSRQSKAEWAQFHLKLPCLLSLSGPREHQRKHPKLDFSGNAIHNIHYALNEITDR